MQLQNVRVEGELSGKGRAPDYIGPDTVDLELPEEEVLLTDVEFHNVHVGPDGWSVKLTADGIH